MTDKGWAKLGATMKTLSKGPHVRVGIFEGSGADRPPEPGARENPTNVELAFWFEFGTWSQPARPWFRITFEKKRPDWAALMKRLLSAIARGKLNDAQALGLLGERAASDLRLTVTQGAFIFAPNALRTIQLKGSSRPGIDTGRMVNAVTYKVAA